MFDGSGVRVVLDPLRAGATFQAVMGPGPASRRARRHCSPDRNLLADLDHIFVDRSLGAVQVPQLLRDASFRLTTMEHYGETQAQSVSDHKWITNDRRVRLDWISQDANIRRSASSDGRCSTREPAILCAAGPTSLAEKSRLCYIAPLAKVAVPHDFRGPFIYTVHPKSKDRSRAL